MGEISVGGWCHGVLDNGLRYYLRPHLAPAGTVRLDFVLKVGELYGQQTRTSQWLQDVLLRSAPFPLTSTDGTAQPSISGFTSAERTVYSLHLHAGRDAVARGLALFARWLQPLSIDRRQLEGLNRHDARLPEQRLFYPWCADEPWIRARLAPGEPPTAEDVAAFHSEWYHPALAAVVIGGQFDMEHARAQLYQAFALVARHPPRPRPYSIVDPSRNTLLVHTRCGKNPYSIYLLKRLPHRWAEDAESYRCWLIDRLLGSTLHAQLRRQAAGAVSEGTAGVMPPGELILGDVTFAGLMVSGDAGAAWESAFRWQLAAYRSWRHRDFEDTIDAARADMMRSWAFSHDTPEQVDLMAISYAFEHFFQKIPPPTELSADDYEALLAGIGTDELQARLRQWLAGACTIIELLHPEELADGGMERRLRQLYGDLCGD